MPPTTVELTNDRAASAAATGAAPRTQARWKRLDAIRAFVVTAVLALLVASAVTYGANLPVDLALAAMWTALVVLVWEVGARALAHLRRGPAGTG
jgi:hypothetical protein